MGTTKMTAREAMLALNLNNYRLCYVDTVSKTYTDYTPESKKLMETEEYKKFVSLRREYIDNIIKKQGYCSSSDYLDYDREHDYEHKFKTEMQEYPHPDFVAGFTHYLYFTDNMNEQWGDDWDDAPYEHNAGEPYDSDTNVIIVPVRIVPLIVTDWDDEGEDKYDEMTAEYPDFGTVDVKLPCDYSYNSPFCVDDINGGAVAWIYALKYKDGKRTHVVINSSDYPTSALAKIEIINNLCK